MSETLQRLNLAITNIEGAQPGALTDLITKSTTTHLIQEGGTWKISFPAAIETYKVDSDGLYIETDGVELVANSKNGAIKAFKAILSRMLEGSGLYRMFSGYNAKRGPLYSEWNRFLTGLAGWPAARQAECLQATPYQWAEGEPEGIEYQYGFTRLDDAEDPTVCLSGQINPNKYVFTTVVGDFVHTSEHVAYGRRMAELFHVVSVLVAAGRKQWVKDLCADGDVEANPGPDGFLATFCIAIFATWLIWEGLERFWRKLCDIWGTLVKVLKTLGALTTLLAIFLLWYYDPALPIPVFQSQQVLIKLGLKAEVHPDPYLMLPAPMLDTGTIEIPVWLPDTAQWYDYFTIGEKHYYEGRYWWCPFGDPRVCAMLVAPAAVFLAFKLPTPNLSRAKRHWRHRVGVANAKAWLLEPNVQLQRTRAELIGATYHCCRGQTIDHSHCTLCRAVAQDLMGVPMSWGFSNYLFSSLWTCPKHHCPYTQDKYTYPAVCLQYMERIAKAGVEPKGLAAVMLHYKPNTPESGRGTGSWADMMEEDNWGDLDDRFEECRTPTPDPQDYDEEEMFPPPEQAEQTFDSDSDEESRWNRDYFTQSEYRERFGHDRVRPFVAGETGYLKSRYAPVFQDEDELTQKEKDDAAKRQDNAYKYGQRPWERPAVGFPKEVMEDYLVQINGQDQFLTLPNEASVRRFLRYRRPDIELACGPENVPKNGGQQETKYRIEARRVAWRMLMKVFPKSITRAVMPQAYADMVGDIIDSIITEIILSEAPRRDDWKPEAVWKPKRKYKHKPTTHLLPSPVTGDLVNVTAGLTVKQFAEACKKHRKNKAPVAAPQSEAVVYHDDKHFSIVPRKEAEKLAETLAEAIRVATASRLKEETPVANVQPETISRPLIEGLHSRIHAVEVKLAESLQEFDKKLDMLLNNMPALSEQSTTAQLSVLSSKVEALVSRVMSRVDESSGKDKPPADIPVSTTPPPEQRPTNAKAAKKKKERTPESVVAHSRPIPKGHLVAVSYAEPGQNMNPQLMANAVARHGTQGRLVLYAPRHCYRAATVADVMPMQYEGRSIWLKHMSTSDWVEVKVADVGGFADAVWYNVGQVTAESFNLLRNAIPTAKGNKAGKLDVADPGKNQDYAQYKGMPVTVMAFNLEALAKDFACNPLTVLTETIGTVRHTSTTLISYDCTTVAGHCRAPVVTQDGKLLAGHWSAKDPTTGFPAGEPFVLAPADVGQWTLSQWDPALYEKAAQGYMMREDDPLNPTKFGLLGRARKPHHDDTQADRLPFKMGRHREEKKLRMLRRDIDITGFTADYQMMKPSTEMNIEQLFCFNDSDRGDGLHFTHGVSQDVIEEAVFLYDVDVSGLDNVGIPALDSLTESLLQLDKSAGLTHEGTHRDYAGTLGAKPAEEFRNEMTDMIGYLLTLPQTEEQKARGQHLCEMGKFWKVMGKYDGYTKKKIDVGRTIQGPTIHLKALYLAYFSEMQERWTKRLTAGEAAWNYTGHDFDTVVSASRLARYRKALGAIAFDKSGYDRNITPHMILAFFRYLRRLCPETPEQVLAYLAEATIKSRMVVSDGTIIQKYGGNPSGFMNTLHMNSVILLNCWINMILEATVRLVPDVKDRFATMNARDLAHYIHNNYHIEICGDDSRVWALREFGIKVLDIRNGGHSMASMWEECYPWKVKPEGHALFDLTKPFITRILQAPHMISRGFVPIVFGGRTYLAEPLVNVSRTVRRWMHDENRQPDLEHALRLSAAMGNALLWSMHRRGQLVSPTVAALDRVLVRDDPELLAYLRTRVSVLASFAAAAGSHLAQTDLAT